MNVNINSNIHIHININMGNNLHTDITIIMDRNNDINRSSA